MSQSNGMILESLNESLNDLAGRAMLVDDEPAAIAPLLAALGKLAGHADEAGYQALSETALELRNESSDADSLREGLLQLQKILEEESKPKRAPKDNAPKAAPVAAASSSLGSDPELLNDFIVEARDHLATIETQVLTLEQDPANKEAVHAIFRGFHTIKGLAGFLELPAIQIVAHEVETLLDMVRNGQLSVTPAMVDGILAGADYLKTDVARLETALAGGPCGDPASNEALVARVHALMSNTAPGPVPAVNAPDTPSAPEQSQQPAPVAAQERSPAEPVARDTKKATESRIIKVDTGKLDFLVDMVGELVIAQSMIRHDGQLSAISNPQLQRNLAQLTRITGEVQKTAMSMRMVPIGQLFQKSVRLVRDLTRKSGKRAEVEIFGEDTELDRTIVEDLSDPLVHMIRNSADHGIEMPDDRVKAGKPAIGRIVLKAYHQAGHIVIEISDDGRGLVREKILKKAKERGLVQDGTNLSDKEVFNLIFEPGFSTAEKITDISGRGVGMDVVRKQIQKMRGRIDIESQPGQGTTFLLKLPLTLAVIDGLVVSVGEERYVLPIFAVREIFRPQADAVFTVENRNEMLLSRGKLLPVVRLHQRFSVEPRSRDIRQGVVIVAESGGHRFCLAVDELIGKQEVVIKSLGQTFKNIPGLAGGAILGDGRVGLILDLEGILGERAHA